MRPRQAADVRGLDAVSILLPGHRFLPLLSAVARRPLFYRHNGSRELRHLQGALHVFVAHFRWHLERAISSRFLAALAWPAGIAAAFQDSRGNAPPRLDNFRTINLIGQPCANQEHATQKIVGQFDELLCALAWVAGNAKRFDPNAIECMACIQHDWMDDPGQFRVRTAGYHHLDHGSKYRTKEEMLGVGKKLGNRVSRSRGSKRQRLCMFHRFPHSMTCSGSNKIILLRKIVLLRATRYACLRCNTAGTEPCVAFLR